jgi:hypothetical protein
MHVCYGAYGRMTLFLLSAIACLAPIVAWGLGYERGRADAIRLSRVYRLHVCLQNIERLHVRMLAVKHRTCNCAERVGEVLRGVL